MKYTYLVIITIQLLVPVSCGSTGSLIPGYDGQVIFEENFQDLKNWSVENSGGRIYINDKEQLEIEVPNGVTIWFNEKLKGNYVIEYEAVVVQLNGQNDRVSDLNCFWKAKDLDNPNNIFVKKRKGNFMEYDSLELYYAGIGVHDNSRARFRRYDGKGNKPLLPEHDLYDEKYRLEPNITYKIKIIVTGNRNRLYRNDMLIYDYWDDTTIRDGWFAFRTFKSHLVIDNFKVTALK